MKPTITTVVGLLSITALLTYCSLLERDATRLANQDLPDAEFAPPTNRPRSARGATGDKSPDADTAMSRSSARRSDSPEAAPATGIWIVGQIHGADVDGERIRITLEHPRTRRRIEANANTDGQIELDVTELVEQDQRASFLRAKFEHPGRLEQSVSIMIEARTRRSGLRDKRVEVGIDIHLQPVTRRIAGVVKTPSGYPMHAVRVVLLEGARQQALPELIDETQPDSDGRFQLGGRAEREAHVVAWLNTTTGRQHRILRPTTVRLPVWWHQARPLALELEPGATIDGVVRHHGQLDAVDLLLTARLSRHSVAEAMAPDTASDHRRNAAQPSVDDQDESEQQLEAFLPAIPKTRKPAEVLTTRRRFVELVYVAGRFEITAVPISVGNDGRFQTAGLRPATTYALGEGRLAIEGRPLGTCPSPDRTWISARVPAIGVQIRFPVQLFLLQVSRADGPLANSVIRIGPPDAQAISDPEGRVVFVAPDDAGKFELTVAAIGYTPQTLWVTANHWQAIELQRRRGTQPPK